jgi:hypothetical protein
MGGVEGEGIIWEPRCRASRNSLIKRRGNQNTIRYLLKAVYTTVLKVFTSLNRGEVDVALAA